MELHGDNAEWIVQWSEEFPLQMLLLLQKTGGHFLLAAEEGARKAISGKEDCHPDIKKITNHLYLKYNTERDWLILCSVLSGFRDEIKKKDLTEIDFCGRYENWECCLVRFWIRVYGTESAKEEFEAAHEEFWKQASLNMTNGQLLHICVELGCVKGVKVSAWPAMLMWRCEETGLTALELAEIKLGRDHEITAFLQKEVNLLVQTGFME